MARLLRLLAGETNAAEVPGAAAIVSFEGTGLLRRTDEFLEAHPDDTATAELTRLRRLLVPSPENLDRVSVGEAPGSRQEGGTHLAALDSQGGTCESI